MLALAAAAGIGGIYSARQDYEDALARAYSLEAASLALFAAGVVEQAALQAPGRTGAGAAPPGPGRLPGPRPPRPGAGGGGPGQPRLWDRAVAGQERVVRLAAAGGRPGVRA